MEILAVWHLAMHVLLHRNPMMPVMLAIMLSRHLGELLREVGSEMKLSLCAREFFVHVVDTCGEF